VADHFLHRPFAGRIAQVAISLTEAGKQQDHLPALLIEGGQNVIARDQRNVAVVIRRILSWLRRGDGESRGGGDFF